MKNRPPFIQPSTLLISFLSLWMLIHSTQVQAQQINTFSLSLDQAIEHAMVHNADIRKSEFSHEIQQAKFRGASAVFLPQIGIEYNALTTNDPLNVFGFKLKQQSVTMQDFDPARLNNPDAYENYSAKIEVRQPVFNADMISQRNAARTMMRSSREQVSATKSMKRFEVTQMYYQLLLQQEQMNVLESGIKTAEAYHRQAKVAFDEGLISRSDLMSASVFELELRSRLLHTKNEFDNLTEQMLLLIGLPANTKLELTDALETDKSAQKNITASPLGLNNAYLRAIGYQVDAAEYMQQAARNAWLPRVNVFGSYELNDRKVFGFSSDAYMVGAQFSWTLFSGLQRSGALREANAQRRTAEVMLENTRREFAMQLEQAHRNLEHAALQIELTKAMIEQAQEDTRIRENRYKQGMEKTTDLLQAETRLLEARLNHYMALFQQRMSLAAIQMIIE